MHFYLHSPTEPHVQPVFTQHQVCWPASSLCPGKVGQVIQTLYTQKKYCIYCMANTKNQDYTHDYLCNLYYALYEGVTTQTIQIDRVHCHMWPESPSSSPSFSFLHSLSSPIIPLFQGERSPFINPPLTVTSVICPCHCSPSTPSIFNPHFLLFCSFHLNAFHPWQAVTSAWEHISICTLCFLSGQQSGNV